MSRKKISKYIKMGAIIGAALSIPLFFIVIFIEDAVCPRLHCTSKIVFFPLFQWLDSLNEGAGGLIVLFPIHGAIVGALIGMLVGYLISVIKR